MCPLCLINISLMKLSDDYLYFYFRKKYTSECKKNNHVWSSISITVCSKLSILNKRFVMSSVHSKKRKCIVQFVWMIQTSLLLKLLGISCRVIHGYLFPLLYSISFFLWCCSFSDSYPAINSFILMALFLFDYSYQIHTI